MVRDSQGDLYYQHNLIYINFDDYFNTLLGIKVIISLKVNMLYIFENNHLK